MRVIPGDEIKQMAATAGFDGCGISQAEYLEAQAPLLDQWLSQNMHGEMSYMANHYDKRLDPRLLVPGAKSVITVLLNYFPEKSQRRDAPKISKYAYGRDYHKVIKSRFKTLVTDLKERYGDFHGRVFVDSAPVMDKVWAEKSGLGWIGKHSNLLNRKMGSFFFIGELICDLPVEPDDSSKDYCGTCTRCIDACPTDAIVEPYVVDGSKCISYLTIELKKEIPSHFKGKMENWAFGCDICQDVCPWNRFSEPTKEKDFQPKAGFLDKTEREWQELTEELFDELFQGSAVKRTGYDGLKRNLRFIGTSDSKQ